MTSWLEASCWLRAWVSVRPDWTEIDSTGTWASLAGGLGTSDAEQEPADDELKECRRDTRLGGAELDEEAPNEDDLVSGAEDERDARAVLAARCRAFLRRFFLVLRSCWDVALGDSDVDGLVGFEGPATGDSEAESGGSGREACARVFGTAISSAGMAEVAGSGREAGWLLTVVCWLLEDVVAGMVEGWTRTRRLEAGT